MQNLATGIPSIKNGSRKDIETICRDLNISANASASTAQYVNVSVRKDSSTVFIDNNIDQALTNRMMPNVLGMGLKDALYLLENAGFKVKVIGKGKIMKQSINAGTKFSKGAELILELS